MQVRKQQLELDMEQQTGSKEEKEDIKAVYCHPAYLTYMQSSVQFSRSVMSDLCDPMTTARQATLSITNPQSSPKPTSIESVMHIMRNAGLEEHKLESRLTGEISITSDMQMTPPLWQKTKKN